MSCKIHKWNSTDSTEVYTQTMKCETFIKRRTSMYPRLSVLTQKNFVTFSWGSDPTELYWQPDVRCLPDSCSMTTVVRPSEDRRSARPLHSSPLAVIPAIRLFSDRVQINKNIFKQRILTIGSPMKQRRERNELFGDSIFRVSLV